MFVTIIKCTIVALVDINTRRSYCLRTILITTVASARVASSNIGALSIIRITVIELTILALVDVDTLIAPIPVLAVIAIPAIMCFISSTLVNVITRKTIGAKDHACK